MFKYIYVKSIVKVKVYKLYSFRFKIHVYFRETAVTKKPNKFCYF